MNDYTNIALIMLENGYSIKAIKEELSDTYNLTRTEIIEYVESALDIAEHNND